MATFVNTIKHIICKAFLLNEDTTFLLLEDGGQIIICDGITNTSKNISIFTNTGKSTSTWTNTVKN